MLSLSTRGKITRASSTPLTFLPLPILSPHLLTQALEQRQRAGQAEAARVNTIYARDVAQATALARAQARERMHLAGVL